MRLSGLAAGYVEKSGSPQSEAWKQWENHFRKLDPRLDAAIEEALGDLRSDEKILEEILAQASWQAGDAERGRKLFGDRQCISCHSIGGKGQRVGPDLTGLGKRFSARDILEAILLPGKTVAPQFQTELFLLKNGEPLEGISVYDSRAAILVQKRDGSFARVSQDQIRSREKQSLSLMPAGLLDGLSSEAIVDLVTYLR
jgi:putative heme-binding domain-containing protein